MKFSKWDYCQYLLSSPNNVTLTHLADHLAGFSHDTINRYLRGVELRPRHLWEQVRNLLEESEEAYLIFDDTVIDKESGLHIELVTRQYSGLRHRVVDGIGLVSCVYLNARTGHFWVIDYRLYDKADGKSKLDQMRAMFRSALKRVPFGFVLMDSWYATKDVMLEIEAAEKVYYCPLKANRLVDDSGGQQPYQSVESLEWTPKEEQKGKRIKIHGFPKEHKVKLFRVVVSPHRTEYLVTNDTSRKTLQDAHTVGALRWKIEEVHREVKQLTGIGKCQCRKARLQRNHFHCALLTWNRLKHYAYKTQQTVYAVKQNLLSDYLIQQLKNPTLNLRSA
jgi:hypothetical protein